jgi:hypothetical protein
MLRFYVEALDSPSSMVLGMLTQALQKKIDSILPFIAEHFDTQFLRESLTFNSF